MMEIPTGTSVEEQWGLYVKNLLEVIDQGLLDNDIKLIARACFDRRDELKKGGGSPQRLVEPPFYVHAEDTANAAAPVPERTRQTQTRTRTTTRGKRRFAGHGDPTFRYVDGRLYHKADVVGQTMTYQEDSGSKVFYITVRGVGPKAAKVEFTSRAGIKLTTPQNVPAKYRDAESASGIKDPIFMGLSVIQPIIDKCNPVKE